MFESVCVGIWYVQIVGLSGGACSVGEVLSRDFYEVVHCFVQDCDFSVCSSLSKWCQV